MSRRILGPAVAVLALGVELAGCAVTASPSPSSAASPSPSLPASPVVGIIVAVDATSLSDVRGFTLRLADGSTVAFTLGTLENPTEFPPGHLKEHQATSVPIRVFFRIAAGVPVVYRIEDASG